MKKYLLLLGFAAIANIGFAQSIGTCVSGDCMNGYGTFRFNGDAGVYIGQFKGGKQHGQGTFVFSSGEKYEGGWVNGAQTGLATFYWSDGRSQKGDWKDGELVRVIDDMELPNSTPPVVEKQPVVVANNPPPKQTVVNTPPKQTQPKQNGSAAIASADGPSISLSSPQVTRGFVVNTALEKMDVIGTAADKDGVRQVRVNGMVAWLAAPNKAKTNFQIPISLVLGQNKIWIEAKIWQVKSIKKNLPLIFQNQLRSLSLRVIHPEKT